MNDPLLHKKVKNDNNLVNGTDYFQNNRKDVARE